MWFPVSSQDEMLFPYWTCDSEILKRWGCLDPLGPQCPSVPEQDCAGPCLWNSAVNNISSRLLGKEAWGRRDAMSALCGVPWLIPSSCEPTRTDTAPLATAQQHCHWGIPGSCCPLWGQPTCSLALRGALLFSEVKLCISHESFWDAWLCLWLLIALSDFNWLCCYFPCLKLV